MVNSQEISDAVAETLREKFGAELKHSDNGFGDQTIDTFKIDGKRFVIDMFEEI